jgi:hypothetical protein
VTLARLKSRPALIGFALIAVGAMLAGFLAATPPGAEIAYAAACKTANGYCPPQVRTASVDVTHLVPGATSSTPVEPDDGESWSITAYWNDNTLPCSELSETATVDASWSGTGWVLSNKSTTSNITDIKVCNEATCAEVDTHSYGYRLYVELNDTIGPAGAFNLRQVTFTASSVDDGYELDTSSCTLGNAVEPSYETYSASDTGLFECYYSCSNAGTTLSITYE